MNKTKLSIPIDTIQTQAVTKFHQHKMFDWDRLKRVTYIKKLINERQIKSLTEELFNRLDPLNKKLSKDEKIDFQSSEIIEAKSYIIDFMKEMDQKQLLFDRPFLSFFIEKGYLDVAEEFIRQAKNEEAELSNEELFQALRNVWIMNSLQLYWHLPLKMSPSVYSYSMLYPYTDNYLDNPHVNPIDKIQFNHRIENALQGKHVPSDVREEQRITLLIKNIENEYNRDKYPQIYESIQLIHDAQVKSMQQGHKKVLEDDKILALSFYKRGTSVLADAFLVKPDLEWEEATFSFEYGAFLQLLDDLQDIAEDTERNHKTYFNFPKTLLETEQKIEQLLVYIYKVNDIQKNDTSNKRVMKEIIRSCTLLMVMEAVGSNPTIVSTDFYNQLEFHSKVRLSFYAEFKDKMMDYLMDFMHL